MKRMISWALLLALVLSLFAGCGAKEAPAAESVDTPAAAPTDAPAVVVPDENLENAIAYLKAFYKDVRSGTQTPADFERLGTVRVGLTAYEVVYTVDCDERDVKVVKGDNGMVKIDINEESEEEVVYTLTATVTGTDGTTASHSWEHILPVSMRGRATEIIDEAYALEEGAALAYEATLTGEIISVDTPYSADYKNITVSIIVEGRENKPIKCYRLKGDGCESLMPGDIITVSGIIKNYKGTIEFDQGCVLKQARKGANSIEIPETEAEILKAAFALKPGAYLPYTATLTGKVVGVGKYSPQYGNRTISIICGDGYFIKCYRLKGQDIDKVWMDDIITVTGSITNYDGTIEFEAGSIMDSWVDKPNPKVPADPAEIVAAAYRLSNFSSLPYYCTLTGKVDKIVSKWNSAKGSVTVDMTVAGKTIQAYKLKGDGVEAIKVGDTITVWGMLKNYYGTIEFDKGCKLINGGKTIVNDAYDLEPGETMEGEQTLTGKVTSVEVSGSSCTAVITVSNQKDKPIICVGMTGSGYDKLEAGDTVTVRGTLTNNDGTYQFKSGCTLVSWSNANRPKVDASNTQAEIVEAAKQLGTADRMVGFILRGTVTQVVTPYDSQYGNVTVVMNAQGESIECYRLDGKGADKIGVGDEIRVSGTLINYNGKLEFTQGCTILEYKINEKPESNGPTEGQLITIGEALALGTTDCNIKLTGKITSISSTTWGNMYISDGTGEIYLYGLYDEAGNRYDAMTNKPVVGDTITVLGMVSQFNGTPQIKNAVALGLAEPPPEVTVGPDSPLEDIVAAVKAGQKLDFEYTVTGTVKAVYDNSDGTKNIPIITSAGQINCNFIPNNGADWENVAAGDTVSIRGKLTLKDGTKIQLNNGTLVARTPAAPAPTEPPATEPPVVEPTTPATVPPTAPATGEEE